MENVARLISKCEKKENDIDDVTATFEFLGAKRDRWQTVAGANLLRMLNSQKVTNLFVISDDRLCCTLQTIRIAGSGDEVFRFDAVFMCGRVDD